MTRLAGCFAFSSFFCRDVVEMSSSVTRYARRIPSMFWRQSSSLQSRVSLVGAMQLSLTLAALAVMRHHDLRNDPHDSRTSGSRAWRIDPDR
jgi:hypothetical protein